MIRKFIKSALPIADNRVDDGTVRSKLKAAIANEIINWKVPNGATISNTIKSVIHYEVNIYMSQLSEAQRIERKKKILKGDEQFISKTETLKAVKSKIAITDKTRFTGTVTITNVSPPQGQIEDGSIISFSTINEIFLNDRFTYAYSKTTGLYTVYTYSRAKIKPLSGKILDDNSLSEQYDNVFFTQAPNSSTSSSVKTKVENADIINTDITLTLVHRLSIDTGCYIKDKKYKEYKKTMAGEPPKPVFTITKEIDLTTYMPINTGETLTIGKYILVNNILCVLFFTDIGYPHKASAIDIDLTRRYNEHIGTAKVKGEVLLINRLTWDVIKVAKTMQSSAGQIRYSGFIDIIKDEKTGKLIVAEMLEDSVETSLTYDTAKIFVAAADSPKTPKEDITKTTCDSWYTILNTMSSNPPKYHIIKEGTKTWTLEYPKLNISLYDIKINADTQQMTFNLESNIYEDNNLITTRYNYDCFGGYINCILYQDIYDPNYTLYIGRSYTSWLQVPFISDDFILQPIARDVLWRADKGKYRNAVLPGEIAGFFGTEFSAIIPKTNDTAAKLYTIADIPGDFGAARTFMKDDVPGSAPAAISGAYTSTHTTLMALADYISNDSIEFIKNNSCSCIFTGGTTNVHYPYNLTAATPVNLWNTGIHTYTTRFIVVHDTNKKLKVVFGGILPLQVSEYNYSDGTSEVFQSHLMTSLSEMSSSGVFIGGNIDETLGLYKLELGGYNFTSKYVSNNPPDIRFPIGEFVSQYIAVNTRVDLLKLDINSYYISQSVYINQFDTFLYNYGGLLWWGLDRQAYKYTETTDKDNKKQSVLYGWMADMPIDVIYPNFVTDTDKLQKERYGAAVNHLQFF